MDLVSISIVLMVVLAICAFYYEIKALNVKVKGKSGLINPLELTRQQIYKGSANIFFLLELLVLFLGPNVIVIFTAIWIPLWLLQKILDKRNKK